MDNKDGSKRVPTGTFGSSTPPSSAPEGADDALAGEPPTVRRRQPQYPDTLRGRPSQSPEELAANAPGQPTASRPPAGAWSTPEEPPSRPSVQSIPPPMAVGATPESDEPAEGRSRAETPDYRGSRAVSQPPEGARAGQAADPEGTVVRKGAPSSIPSSLLPTLPPPSAQPSSAGRGFALDAQAWWGIGLVALMVAIGVGGWYATGGTFPNIRDLTPPAPPTPAPTAVPAQSAVPVPAVQPPAAKPEAATPPSATAAEPALAGSRVPARAKPSALLDVPTSDDVRDALSPLRAAIDECARGRKGVAQLELTVANTGRVSNVVVGGDFAGSAEGTCIGRVARTAQFARFKKARFRIVYPLSL